MPNVYVGSKLIRLDPQKAIGKGGEADIFDIGGGTVLKLYKGPNHPDLLTASERQSAIDRLALVQKKLPLFPQKLPPQVVNPRELARDKSGLILGYCMPYISGDVLKSYSEKPFRQGVSHTSVMEVFKNLHPTVSGIHQTGVVIGDFNDLNVLVSGTQAYVIDADSFQFGGFLSPQFTATFVDPLLVRELTQQEKDAQGKQNVLFVPYTLVRPHNPNSDWYAFAVMLFDCLTFVNPFGGVYRPKNPNDKVKQDERALHRISVFHKEVIYPKPALPLQSLSDDLLDFFQQTFDKDKRGMFPLSLLEQTHWNTCPNCGLEHARRVCPVCAVAVPVTKIPAVIVRGKVSSTFVFETKGTILFATLQEGKLCYLYHENDQFKREGGHVILQGMLDPHVRYRIKGSQTLIAKGNQLVILGDNTPQPLSVDTYRVLPMFDANERHHYFVQGGKLFRDGRFGTAEYIGDVLQNHTLFWVGREFGFGFYWAGELSVAFIFDAEHPGVNDSSITLRPINGQLIDSTAVFGRNQVWFFQSIRSQSKTINRCHVITDKGVVVGYAEAEEGDGSWLGTIRGKTAARNFLLAATDQGIVRVEVSNGQIFQTQQFPDTEPFVDSASSLFLSTEGLFVVGGKEIRLLKIS